MARTAPVPNIPAIPGMNPGAFVMAGGGAGGGGSGKGGSGAGGAQGADGEGGGDGASGGGGSAGTSSPPDPGTYPHCGTRSCPVEVVTGRAFTLETVDFRLPGPMPLRFFRVHSSAALDLDCGLGPGWSHSLAWEVGVGRRFARVWTAQGTCVDFHTLAPGASVQGRWGWILHRTTNGYVLDADDGLKRHFEEQAEDGRRYRLTRIVDRNGNTVQLRYGNGVLSQIVDSAGRELRLHHDPRGHITAIDVRNAAARGQWVSLVRYAYDERGCMLSATDADNFSNRYRYDADFRLLENGYKSGIVFYFVYDAAGRCTESWGAYPGRVDPSLAANLPTHLADGKTPIKGVHHCRYEYMPDNFTQVYDSTRVTSYQGNALGLLERSAIGSGVMTASYDNAGFLISETNEVGATSDYTRDSRGRILTTTDALGNLHTTERDANGRPVLLVDPEGGTTHITRDERGNIVTLRDAEGGVTAFEYDDRGLPTKLVSSTGGTTHWTYDGQGNRTQTTSPTGGTWTYTYDGLGRLLSIADPDGAARSHSYSNRGDLIAVRDMTGGVSRYSYDGDGFMTQSVNPHGSITKLEWGGLHKLVGRVNANGARVSLRYNHEGELLEIHNEAGEKHLLERDLVGLLVGETTFDGRRFRYENDALGRVVGTIDSAEQTTKYVYDALGRLVEEVFHDGTSRVYEHDWRGRLLVAKNASSELVFQRDLLGRIVREQQTFDGQTDWVESHVDPDGYRTARTTSLGHEERISRNAYGGRVQTVIDGEKTIHHERDRLGREIERMLPGGGRIFHEYDVMSRVTRTISFKPSDPADASAREPEWIGEMPMLATHELTFHYRSDGELAGRGDSHRGSTAYEYDPVGQLLSYTPERAREQLFQYDLRGNRSESTPGAPVREYGAGSQILRKGDLRYRWDALGRVVEKRQSGAPGEDDAVWLFTWNSEGLLAEVELPDGSSIRYLYDALSRRLGKELVAAADRKHRVTASVRFVWDGNHIAHDIRTTADNAGDPVVEERTFGFDDSQFEPLYQSNVERASTTANTVYYLNDQAGAVDCLVGPDGERVWACTRSPWGESKEGASGESSPFRLQGQYLDEETGLHYNRNRYYDPALGFFISADPLGLDAGHHDYRYAPNPLQWIDPLGLVTAALMASMADEDRPVPDGSTAHHIVQRNGGGDGGTRARACLARNNIDIDDGANGARLKGTARTQRARAGHEKGCEGYHGGNDIHGDAAMTRVADRLEAAEARGGAAEVEEELRTMGRTMETSKPGERNL